eukprot:m.251045 g.251045  ORF g.251045 m.251045 type:complete len:327 (-) comp19102_c6_seq3:1516-2496(-)
MTDAHAQSELSSDALAMLTEQVFANMKFASQPLEDLVKAAQRYQALMEQAAEAGSAFVDALGKVAVTAARARGATSELGGSFQKVVGRHVALIAEKQNQARKFTHQFIVPLQKRLKSDVKTFNKMEDDFKSMTKHYKSDLKKAGKSTVTAQKLATKGKDATALETALKTMMAKSREFEEFNQKCLRSALIEERRRYCYLVDNYYSVFQPEFPSTDQAMLSETLAAAENPEELPPSSEALIAQNSSGAGSAPPSPRLQPSAITQEIAAHHRALPPGAPPGGLSMMSPTPDQINPRARTNTSSVRAQGNLDGVLAEQFGRLPGGHVRK